MNPYNDQATDQPIGSIAYPSESTPNVIPTKLMIKPPKGVIHKSTFNRSARVAQNYNIVEDLEKAPLAMSTLVVLQNYPTQKKSFLLSIGCIYPSDSNLVVFNHENDTP